MNCIPFLFMDGCHITFKGTASIPTMEVLIFPANNDRIAIILEAYMSKRFISCIISMASNNS